MQSRTSATAALASIALLAGGTAFASNASAATKAKAVTCAKGTEIDYVGPITGPNGNLGVNISRGAELAITEFNKANKGCQIVFKTQDTQGDPDQAILVAPKVIANKKVIGVVGPAFSGETDKTGKLFADAVLPSISPSATRVSLSSNGWATFHRALANDGKQSHDHALPVRTEQCRNTQLAGRDTHGGVRRTIGPQRPGLSRRHHVPAQMP